MHITTIDEADDRPLTEDDLLRWGAERVDALWILSGPDSPHELDTHFIRVMFDVFDESKVYRWSVNGVRCVGHPTRGDIRLLCRALGIKLKETT